MWAETVEAVMDKHFPEAALYENDWSLDTLMLSYLLDSLDLDFNQADDGSICIFMSFHSDEKEFALKAGAILPLEWENTDTAYIKQGFGQFHLRSTDTMYKADISDHVVHVSYDVMIFVPEDQIEAVMAQIKAAQ
jgi:hypothetical protein